MESDFTNITERIEERRLAIVEALKQEEDAIRNAEPRLIKRYNKSVQNVLNGLINSTEQQGKELFRDYKKSNDLLRLSFIKTRNQLLKVLLPSTLFLGVIIGTLATHFFIQLKMTGTWVRLEDYEIVKSNSGRYFIDVTQTLQQKKIKKE